MKLGFVFFGGDGCALMGGADVEVAEVDRLVGGGWGSTVTPRIGIWLLQPHWALSVDSIIWNNFPVAPLTQQVLGGGYPLSSIRRRFYGFSRKEPA